MQPQEIAAGVYRLEVGRGLMRSNVWFVHSGTRWALIDTGPPGCSQLISEAAKRLGIGDGALSAILLTHDHPDHAGSTHDLVEVWRSPVYVHPDELRFVKADATNFFAVYEPTRRQSRIGRHHRSTGGLSYRSCDSAAVGMPT